MNKALHALVYFILATAITALVFEIKIYEKRYLLGDQLHELQTFVGQMAGFVEEKQPDNPEATEADKKKLMLDEGLIDDQSSPLNEDDLENVQKNAIPEYRRELEPAENPVPTFKWTEGTKERRQLTKYYLIDTEGNPIPDELNYGRPTTKGPGTAHELLELLLKRSREQYTLLNNTRAELPKLRVQLERVIADHNKLKQDIRADKKTIREREATIEKLKQEKAALEEQIARLNENIQELNAQIVSITDERNRAQEETQLVKDDLAKHQEKIEQLEQMVKELNRMLSRGGVRGDGRGGVGTLDTNPLTLGKKGEIVKAGEGDSFVIVKFNDESIKQLLGPELDKPLPLVEFEVERAGVIVGRIRLQSYAGEANLVLANILTDWKQGDERIQKGDEVWSR